MAGRPTLIRGQLAAVLPRHGPAVREQRGQHQEQVVLDHRRGRRARRAASNGVIIAQGGRFGGWAVYVKDGRLTFVYNVLGIQRVHHRGRRPRAGRAGTSCAWSSPTTAAGWPRAATSPSSATAPQWAPAGSTATQPMVFSADETTDIGYESGTTVTPDYSARDSAASPASCTGSSSTSAPTTTTTSSIPRNACAWRCRGSRRGSRSTDPSNCIGAGGQASAARIASSSVVVGRPMRPARSPVSASSSPRARPRSESARIAAYGSGSPAPTRAVVSSAADRSR